MNDGELEVPGDVEVETGNTLYSTVSVLAELPFLSITVTKT